MGEGDRDTETMTAVEMSVQVTVWVEGYRDTETMTAVEMSVQVTVWVGVTETLRH